MEATRANKLEVPGGRRFGGERLRAGGTGVSWAQGGGIAEPEGPAAGEQVTCH
ncbi:MAG: hypothetical protein M3R38_35450 [Actinomycetota bacterium]|nr:hypothetical protein [Actinomycetota bacterium]